MHSKNKVFRLSHPTCSQGAALALQRAKFSQIVIQFLAKMLKFAAN